MVQPTLTYKKHVKTKTPEEVEEYSKVFWKRIEELPEYQKHVRNIERGEQTLENRRQAQETVKLLNLWETLIIFLRLIRNVPP